MADFERASVHSDANEIKSVKEAEMVLDKVLSREGVRSQGSGRRAVSHSHHSRKSMNNDYQQKDIAARGAERSQASRKSVQDSLNRLREQKRRESGLNKDLNPVCNKESKTGQAIAKDLANINSMNNTLKSKLKNKSSRFSKAQVEEYDSFFKNGALIKLPPVQMPTVCFVDAGRITFVAANDAHSKESNFGYSRNKFGGFYNH